MANLFRNDNLYTTERKVKMTGSHCRRRTAAGTARYIIGVPRVFGREKAGVFVGAVHGKLVHVQLPDDDGIRILHLFRNGPVVYRVVVRQKFAGGGGAYSFRHQVVLQAGRQAVEKT